MKEVFRVGFVSRRDSSNEHYNELTSLQITGAELDMLRIIYAKAFPDKTADAFMSEWIGADMSQALDKMMDYCTGNIGDVNASLVAGEYGSLVLLISKLLYSALHNSGKRVVLFTEKTKLCT